MNDRMHELVVMAAIALYKTKGAIEAIAYLKTKGGFTLTESINVLAQYDLYEDMAKADLLW